MSRSRLFSVLLVMWWSTLTFERVCLRRAHLGVGEERQDEHRQHQIRHRQADDEVVGGGFQCLLRQDAQTHQQVPADDHHDQQHPEHQGGQVALLRRCSHRRAQVGCHLLRGCSVPSRAESNGLSWRPWRTLILVQCHCGAIIASLRRNGELESVEFSLRRGGAHLTRHKPAKKEKHFRFNNVNNVRWQNNAQVYINSLKKYITTKKTKPKQNKKTPHSTVVNMPPWKMTFGAVKTL